MSKYADLVAADGAIHHWPLGETSGTTAVDGPGTADGTYTGTFTLNQPGLLASNNDPAVDLTVPTGYVSIPSTANITTLPFSWELWFECTQAEFVAEFGDFGGTGLWSRYVSTLLARFRLRVESDDLYRSRVRLHASDDTNFGMIAEGPAIDVLDGEPHHLVVTMSAAETRVYVDAQLGQVVDHVVEGYDWGTGPQATATGVTQIGRDAQIPAAWPGRLQHAAVYPAVLTPAQIVDHFATGRASFERYTAQAWVNAPSTASPLGATRLNTLEGAIAATSQRVFDLRAAQLVEQAAAEDTTNAAEHLYLVKDGAASLNLASLGTGTIGTILKLDDFTAVPAWAEWLTALDAIRILEPGLYRTMFHFELSATNVPASAFAIFNVHGPRYQGNIPGPELGPKHNIVIKQGQASAQLQSRLIDTLRLNPGDLILTPTIVNGNSYIVPVPDASCVVIRLGD